jgi:hypothetical protein
MRPELQNYLLKKFPKLYTDCGEQKPFTQFGFECDDGWFRLILWLSRYLQDYIDQQNQWSEKYPDQYLPVKQIKVVQVKEKFATLRFYVDGGNDRTQSIVSFVEYMSGYICERSGRTDDIVVNSKGWNKTQHISFAKKGDNLNYVDDPELRSLLKEDPNQLKFKL